MYKTYIDELGRRWLRLSKQIMWNSEAGWGGWFNGSRLTLEVAPKNTKLKGKK